MAASAFDFNVGSNTLMLPVAHRCCVDTGRVHTGGWLGETSLAAPGARTHISLAPGFSHQGLEPTWVLRLAFHTRGSNPHQSNAWLFSQTLYEVSGQPSVPLFFSLGQNFLLLAVMVCAVSCVNYRVTGCSFPRCGICVPSSGLGSWWCLYVCSRRASVKLTHNCTPLFCPPELCSFLIKKLVVVAHQLPSEEFARYQHSVLRAAFCGTWFVWGRERVAIWKWSTRV